MPMTGQRTQEPTPSSSWGWRTIAKATVVFASAIGGYAVVRASGWWSGWGSETLSSSMDKSDTSLVTNAGSLYILAQNQPSSSAQESFAGINSANPSFDGHQLTGFQGIDLEDISKLVESDVNKFTDMVVQDGVSPSSRRKRGVNGAEFLVNTYTFNGQETSSITKLTNENFVIVWTSSQDNGYGIFAQIFTASGLRVGSEFQVNTFTTFNQWKPVIASFDNGGFVVSWESFGQENGSGIDAQIFTSNGTKMGVELRVNTFTANDQTNSAITVLTNNDFVVVWESGTDIYAQRFNINGVKIGTQFLINTYTTNIQSLPVITSLINGNFVVSWESIGQDGVSNSGIYAQIFSPTGTKIGSEFRVNTYTTNAQTAPAITSFANSRFAISWVSASQEDVGYTGIYAQLFDVNGSHLGNEFQVNSYTFKYQLNPMLTQLANGDFIVSWESLDQDGNGWGIYSQIFTASGAKVGTEFQVNMYTTSHQINSALVGLDDGSFIVSWQSAGQDGSSWGIYARVFTLLIEANDLIIKEGETINLSSNHIQGILFGEPQFSITNVTQGFFSLKTAPQNVINEFSWKNLTDEIVQITHDGGEISLGYNIAATYGIQNTIPIPANVTFISVNDPPILLNNSLTIQNGQSVILKPSDLSATDIDTLASNLLFIVSDVGFGIFENTNTPGTSISQFSQPELENGNVQFNHGGNNRIPTYKISVSDGQNSSLPQAANITFIPINATSGDLTPTDDFSKERVDWVSLLPIILGAGGGALLICAIVTGLVVKRERDNRQKQRDKFQAEKDELNERLHFLETLAGADNDEGKLALLQAERISKIKGKEGHTIIAGRWALITRIRQDEALALMKQTGYAINFPENQRNADVHIGSGYFGKVRLARNVRTNLKTDPLAQQFVGVKKIKGEYEIKSSLKEADIQRKLIHVPYVMPLYDMKQTTDSKNNPVIYQFMLFAGFGNGGTLQACLAKLDSQLQRERLVLQIGYQLLQGIAGMHAQHVYHRDFKPDNFVLDHQGKVYLIDFGWAREFQTDDKVTDRSDDNGDIHYCSPERIQFHHKRSDHYRALPNDMWTLGLTLYELLANESLFADKDMEDLMRERSTMVDYLETRPAYKAQKIPGLWQFIRGLLKRSPEERLTADQALALPVWKEGPLFKKEAEYQQAFAELKPIADELRRERQKALDAKRQQQSQQQTNKPPVAVLEVTTLPSPIPAKPIDPRYDIKRPDKEEIELTELVIDIPSGTDETSIKSRYKNPEENSGDVYTSNKERAFFKPTPSSESSRYKNPEEIQSTLPGLSHQPAESQE